METPAAPAVTFESFGLRAEVLTALKGLGYEEPTPIQRETIPALIGKRDVLGQAATGTGKTAAFALPMMELVNPKDRKPFEAQALVLVPTRELAMQVAEAVQKYGAGIGVTALAVYGGQEIFNQVRPKIEQALAEATGKGVTDSHQLEQVMRRAIGSWVGGKIRRRPMIIPVVIQA